MASKNNYIRTAKKLQTAIKRRFGVNLLINSSQWFSQKKNMAITVYSVKRAIWNEEKQKFTNVELFTTYSQIQLLLFVRDFWYELNGWEVPTDNKGWNEAKKKYAETKEASDRDPKPGKEDTA